MVPSTFNRITVDGDTSTNDTCVVLANGLAGNPLPSRGRTHRITTLFFLAALTARRGCAPMHAGDGEGAAGSSPANRDGGAGAGTGGAVKPRPWSAPLFKGGGLRPGRQLGAGSCAPSATPGGDFSIKVCVWLSSPPGRRCYVCENAASGPPSPARRKRPRFWRARCPRQRVDMGTGDASAKAWGCDLTYDYVKINGDYRT